MVVGVDRMLNCLGPMNGEFYGSDRAESKQRAKIKNESRSLSIAGFERTKKRPFPLAKPDAAR
jgi:hypothetical protein